MLFGLLATTGCSKQPEFLGSTLVERTVVVEVPATVTCPAANPQIKAESKRRTPIKRGDKTLGYLKEVVPELGLSEERKNALLAEAAAHIAKCRKGATK